MRTRDHFIKICILALAAITLTACSSTRVASTWADTHSRRPALDKVMIAGLAHNPGNRLLFEETLAKEFGKRGITAVPSLSRMSGSKNTSTASVLAEARKEGINFVVVTRVLNIGEKEILIPEYNPILYAYEGAGHPFGEINKFQKNTRIMEKCATLETDLYDARTGKVIWTGTTETVKPDAVLTARDVIGSVCGIVSEKLCPADTRG